MMRRHATECMASLIRKTLSLSGCQEATIFFHDAAKAVLPPLSKLGHLPTRSVVTPVPSSKVDLRPLVLPTIFSHIIDRFKVNGSFLSHPIRGGIGALILCDFIQLYSVVASSNFSYTQNINRHHKNAYGIILQ